MKRPTARKAMAIHATRATRSHRPRSVVFAVGSALSAISVVAFGRSIASINVAVRTEEVQNASILPPQEQRQAS